MQAYYTQLASSSKKTKRDRAPAQYATTAEQTGLQNTAIKWQQQNVGTAHHQNRLGKPNHKQKLREHKQKGQHLRCHKTATPPTPTPPSKIPTSTVRNHREVEELSLKINKNIQPRCLTASNNLTSRDGVYLKHLDKRVGLGRSTTYRIYCVKWVLFEFVHNTTLKLAFPLKAGPRCSLTTLSDMYVGHVITYLLSWC